MICGKRVMILYGYKCGICGARLDPGEKCDCTKKERPEMRRAGEKTYIHYSKEDSETQEDFEGRTKDDGKRKNM